MNPELQAKYEHMQSLLRELGRVAVAYSGGVDSAFVLKAALDTLGPENVLAVTGRSASVADGEFDAAFALAKDWGAEHAVLNTNEFDDPRYLANPTNRCFYCKTSLYSGMNELIRDRGIAWIVNGTNADDLTDWRPGLKAAAEWNVRAPAAEAGLTKDEIRELSRLWGLPTHDKPANPCLSSRVPYGESITPEKLRMIERAEQVLHQLGFRECRVRHHGESLARIEVPLHQLDQLLAPQLRERVDTALKEIGYRYVSVDLKGFRSGSLNEVIAFGRRQS